VLAAPLAVVVLPEKATSTNFGASKRSVVAHILGADVRLVPVAALAGVVLPDGDTIALEEFSGTHLLGAAATIVLAAPLAGAVLPDKAGLRTVFVARHSSVVALLLGAAVRFPSITRKCLYSQKGQDQRAEAHVGLY
jgi:hypothetical protein